MTTKHAIVYAIATFVFSPIISFAANSSVGPTGPAAVVLSPANGTQDVSTSTTITVTLPSAASNPSAFSVSNPMLTITPPMPFSSVVASGAQIVYTTQGLLAPSTTYSLVFKDAVATDSVATQSWSFTTGVGQAPASVTPANLATSFDPDTQIVITLQNAPVGTPTTAMLTSTDDSFFVTGVTVSGKTITYTLGTLTTGTTYQINFNDPDDQINYAWQFTTVTRGDLQNLCNNDVTQGEAGDCRFIQNPDLQNLCNSEPSGSGADDCKFIKDPDLQNLCNSEASGGGANDCRFIKNPDLQNLCNSEVSMVDNCRFIKDADLLNLCESALAGLGAGGANNCGFIK